MRRSTKSCLLSGALALSATAAAALHNPGAFVHLTTRSWFTLDPASAFDAVSVIVTGNVYEPLIAFKSVHDSDSFIPFLAEEVPTRENGLLSSDGTLYRFPIRKAVRFHNGETLSPEDVRYSLLRFMLSDAEGGPSALLLKPVLGVHSTRDARGKLALDFKEAAEAIRVDGDAVLIRLKRPDATFLKILASLPIIVSKSWSAGLGEWDGSEAAWKRFNNRPAGSSALHGKMNGTGPFKLAEADADGRQLQLARNDAYWRAPAALERIYLRVVPSKALRLWMLENGDADSSYFEDRDYNEASALQDVRIVQSAPSAALGEVLFFTFRAEPGSPALGSGKLDAGGVPADFFADRDVREGFAYALDYEGYLKRGLALRGTRARGPVPDALLPDQAPPRRGFDLDKSAAAFKKAYGGKLWETGFTVALTHSTSIASRMVLAELLKAGLEKVNPKFQLKIRCVASEELYTEAERHRLPLFISGYYSDYPDPHSFVFGMLHGSGYYPKAQRYANPELDRRIDAAAAVLDPEKRRAAYREILALAAEDIPQLVTYQPSRFSAVRAEIAGADADHNIGNLGLNNFPYFYAYSKG